MIARAWRAVLRLLAGPRAAAPAPAATLAPEAVAARVRQIASMLARLSDEPAALAGEARTLSAAAQLLLDDLDDPVGRVVRDALAPLSAEIARRSAQLAKSEAAAAAARRRADETRALVERGRRDAAAIIGASHGDGELSSLRVVDVLDGDDGG